MDHQIPSLIEISIVSPVYMASFIVPELVNKISDALDDIGITYEIILVDDGSQDHSWESIQIECQKSKKVKGIKLSRNFGQHIAITAGLEHARGNWTVVMDCDLQDDPKEIKNLYQMALNGFDVVLAQRAKRVDGKLKRLSSIIFYGIFGYLTGTEQDSSIANFGIYSHKVTKAIISMGDSIRYFPAMAQWVGFKRTRIPVKHSPRYSGKSTYDTRKLINMATNNIIAFSDKPLRLAIAWGFIIAAISFTSGVIYLGAALMGMLSVSGFASIIISLYFTTGAIIFVLGLVGLYVGKSFDKVKDRPLYIAEYKENI